MNMALDAFVSKTAKYSKSKTRFIARLLDSDVDASTMVILKRALGATTRRIA